MAIQPTQAVAKELIIPPEKLTLDAKLEYCELVREKLRREHNAMGVLFTDGKISEAQWETYKRDVFGPKNTATSEAILAVRQVPKVAARVLDDKDAKIAAIDTDAVFSDVSVSP